METKSLEGYLNSFGKQVVNRAKASLGKAKGGKTALAQSIRFELMLMGLLCSFLCRTTENTLIKEFQEIK